MHNNNSIRIKCPQCERTTLNGRCRCGKQKNKTERVVINRYTTALPPDPKKPNIYKLLLAFSLITLAIYYHISKETIRKQDDLIELLRGSIEETAPTPTLKPFHFNA